MRTLASVLLLLAFALPASAQSTSVMIEDLTWPKIQSAIAAGKIDVTVTQIRGMLTGKE
jgi:hypothetical protein